MDDSLRIRIFDKELKRYINPDDTDYYIDSSGRVILEVESITESGVVEFKYIDIATENDIYAVERCTGLRDKNGRLIYDGDIVFSKSAKAKGIIRFQDGAFIFDWKFAKPLAFPILKDTDDVEIVGNIHEVEK